MDKVLIEIGPHKTLDNAFQWDVLDGEDIALASGWADTAREALEVAAVEAQRLISREVDIE